MKKETSTNPIHVHVKKKILINYTLDVLENIFRLIRKHINKKEVQ